MHEPLPEPLSRGRMQEMYSSDARNGYHRVITSFREADIEGGHTDVSVTFSCLGEAQELYYQSGGIAKHEENCVYKDQDSSVCLCNNGVFVEDLLFAVRDRLQLFNSGKFPCRENALAITAVEEALGWLNQRTIDRRSRGVEGLELK